MEIVPLIYHLKKYHATMTENDAYISNKMQLQKHSITFIHKNNSLPSATSILSRSPMVYNNTASLEKLTRTNSMDFGKGQDGLGQFSWFKSDSNSLDVKLKVFKKDDKKEFRLVQNLPMGNGRGRFQPVSAIEESAGQCMRILC